MTQTDYEQKKRECWDDYTRKCAHEGKSAYGAFLFAFDRAYALGKQEIKQEIKQEKDAEGEEMLCVKAKTVREMYAANDRLIADHAGDEIEHDSATINDMLRNLFGSKCLPDDTNLSEKLTGSEPKFRKDEKVRIKGVAGFDVIKAIYGTGKDGYRYELVNEIAIYDESDLEPYTEPKKKRHVSVKEVCEILGVDESEATTLAKSEPTETCTNDCQSQCKSQEFDDILKRGFSKERRLNIAAMIMAAMMQNAKWGDKYSHIATISCAAADALIAEAEKGDSNA